MQVSTQDLGGGAEQDAWRLFDNYRNQGHPSWLAVGRKQGSDPDVLPLPNHKFRDGWSKFWWQAHARLHGLDGSLPGVWRLSRLARRMVGLGKSLDSAVGIEDFRHPGAWHLLGLSPHKPEIVHCHNLHGGYFDLRALVWLSRQIPVVLTMHDAWLLSGHCAHSLGCDRWQTGCGHCPDLALLPAVKRDATAYNWRRKQKIYRQSRLYVAAPSRWLMQKVEKSMLAPAARQTRIIPYGLDLTLFQPADKLQARACLNIPPQAKVLLFTANGIRHNIWKDYDTLRDALARLAQQWPNEPLLLIALGEDGPPEQIGSATVHFVPFQKEARIVARYYQAADVYIHPARADTFPNTVLEALACGTPVAATAVGGIPEQIKSLAGMGQAQPAYGPDEATGILVAPGQASPLAAGLLALLSDDALRHRLGENAARDAAERFNITREAQAYLAWYQEIVEDWNRNQS